MSVRGMALNDAMASTRNIRASSITPNRLNILEWLGGSMLSSRSIARGLGIMRAGVQRDLQWMAGHGFVDNNGDHGRNTRWYRTEVGGSFLRTHRKSPSLHRGRKR